MSTRFALVAKRTKIAQSDDLQSRKQGRLVHFFFLFFKKSTAKVPRCF